MIERPQPTSPTGSPTPPRVLYVEDNATNVELVRGVVQDLAEIDFIAAPTAEAGIIVARSVRLAAVLMDIHLPGMSGLEAVRALRAHADTRDVPVIALTASTLVGDRRRGLEAGFFDWVTKPIDVDRLLDALARAIRAA